ncbi:hypothetical protein GCM10020367_11570 [Streptomyces sannanensis]|uniref:Uncharacterized protein n=1 Tax=Streptomyces sannanensis TaxID=285536 RepID=A0ABP6S7K3_9ACTN
MTGHPKIATSSELDPKPLVGTWLNTDHGASGGILRIAVTEHDGGLRVRAFGTGSPDERDWGEVPAVLFGAGADPRVGPAFTAEFDLGFLRTVIAGTHKFGILATVVSTAFRDGSGRADYLTREFFHRIGGQS